MAKMVSGLGDDGEVNVLESIDDWEFEIDEAWLQRIYQAWAMNDFKQVPDIWGLYYLPDVVWNSLTRLHRLVQAQVGHLKSANMPDIPEQAGQEGAGENAAPAG